ncbi:MAG: Hsp33 family molecular chaperone HslO [Sphingosinicella sp.]
MAMARKQIAEAAAASHLDLAVGFVLPGRGARGRLVRLGPVLDDILSAHDYPAPVARILAEALVLTALLGAMLKESQGQLTLQAQAEAGIIDLLVCDYRGGELRGYVRYNPERLAAQPSLPSLFALFGDGSAAGKGFLAITFDQPASKERYQGIVPLEGESLADAAQHFFGQSEQIPSLVRLAVSDTGHVAGGLLLQHLPEGEEGRDRLHSRLDHPNWEHVRLLEETIRANELVDPGLAAEVLLWRLFHEENEVRVHAGVPLGKGCRCSLDYVRQVIGRFGAEERAEMVDDEGFISVDCEFCSRVFPIRLEDLGAAAGKQR